MLCLQPEGAVDREGHLDDCLSHHVHHSEHDRPGNLMLLRESYHGQRHKRPLPDPWHHVVLKHQQLFRQVKRCHNHRVVPFIQTVRLRGFQRLLRNHTLQFFGYGVLFDGAALANIQVALKQSYCHNKSHNRLLIWELISWHLERDEPVPACNNDGVDAFHTLDLFLHTLACSRLNTLIDGSFAIFRRVYTTRVEHDKRDAGGGGRIRSTTK
mmetsp:Transcript_21666/g.41364  ORF Transcript_21666/g.41364 Transcript_21666/m.41364 type:complete len:212 (-) Transcript_21666:15-650(-)